MPYEDFLLQEQQPQIDILPPAMSATPGSISYGPFQGPVDPSTADRSMQRAKFYEWNGGQKNQIPNPYKTGIPLQPDPAQQQGYIQAPAPQGYAMPPQYAAPQPMYSNPGYQVQTIQAAPMQIADWASTPDIQALQQQYLQGALQRAIKSQQGPSGFSKAARIFGTKIAPALVGAFGGAGGAIAGGAMAQQGILATRNAQAHAIQEQQAATDALRAAINMVQTTGIKPYQEMAKQTNAINKFNAGQANNQAQRVYTQGQQNQRQANNLTWQGYKFDTNQDRLERNQRWKENLAQNKIDLNIDQFNRTLDLKQQIHNDMMEFRKLNQKIAIRGQDAGLMKHAQTLAARIRENMVDHQYDVNKFNQEMQFKVEKAIRAGDFQEGMDPQKFMLEFDQAAALDPSDLGMSLPDYDQLMEQISLASNGGSVPQMQQAPQQQLPMQQQPMQMQQAPAPYVQQPQSSGNAPFKRGSLLNSAGKKPAQPQQALPPVNTQRFLQSSGGDTNAARGRLVQAAMSRGMSYQAALQTAEAILSGQQR